MKLKEGRNYSHPRIQIEGVYNGSPSFGSPFMYLTPIKPEDFPYLTKTEQEAVKRFWQEDGYRGPNTYIGPGVIEQHIEKALRSRAKAEGWTGDWGEVDTPLHIKPPKAGISDRPILFYDILAHDAEIEEQLLELANRKGLKRSYNPFNPLNNCLNITIMETNEKVLIDLTSTHWRLTETKTVGVLEMQDSHIQNCILLLANKTAAIENLKISNPKAYELCKDVKIDKRTPEQWIMIFTMVLEERKKRKKLKEAKEVLDELDKLKTVEERRTELNKKLEAMGFNNPEEAKQLSESFSQDDF
jgi:hypothetical protein